MKPRINAKSLPILIELDERVRRSDYYKASRLHELASDVLDSGTYRHELDDLIRRRFLAVSPAEGPRGPLCGQGWTVDLTQRAMRTFWPHRLAS